MKADSPRYFLGDLVEFVVGGFGVVDYVNPARAGWPVTYSTLPVVDKLLPDHPTTKRAWHYEGDIKRRIL